MWRRLLRFRAHICVGLLAVVIDVDTDCTNVKPVQVQTDICNVNFNLKKREMCGGHWTTGMKVWLCSCVGVTFKWSFLMTSSKSDLFEE